MSFEQFCGDKFWDTNSTWDTDRPHLTVCFQNTVLVWLPCAFLLLSSPVYYFCYLRHVTLPFAGGRRMKSKLHLAKKVLTAILMVLQVACLVESSMVRPRGYQALFVSSAVQMLTFGISLVLLVYEGRKRLVTSGLHFLFYSLLLLSAILKLTSLAMTFEKVDFNMVATSLNLFLVLVQFVVFCFADTTHYDSIPRVDYFRDKEPCPETQASFLSRLTYFWLIKLIVTGYKKTLTESDLWSLNPRDATEKGAEELYKNWTAEVNRQNIKNSVQIADAVQNSVEMDESSPLLAIPGGTGFRSPSLLLPSSPQGVKKASLFRVILKTFGAHLLLSHVIKLVCDVLVMVSPLLQSLLIDFVEKSTANSSGPLVQVWKGYLYTCLLLANTLLYSLLFQQVHFIGMTAGMRVNASVIALVYKKALSLSSEARKTITVGEIVNLMSVDAQRLQDSLPFFWMAWSSPFQIVLSLYFLWNLVGVSVLAGVAVIVFFVPINALVATVQKKLQLRQMRKKDERIKLMNEILNGIKLIKLYAWEMSFEEKVEAVRGLELDTLRKFCYLGAFSTFAWTCAPFIVTLATFATFIMTGGVLDANVAFTALSFFNILRFPISIFPLMITLIIMTLVSLLRIETFLLSEELPTNNVMKSPSKDAVTITKASFAWGARDEPVLKDIDLSIKKGSLTAVVGQVGSGKSSLISAILGEMEKLRGVVNVDGRIGYVSQQAWIQNATLRDNILFGQAYRMEKYVAILEACALAPDLQVLPAGDDTEIGEKGINLSGGQKQRVSLARSLYQDCDIYLFDDPLSAVDSHVAKHIFEHVIGPAGYLKSKTRVLVTHGITWLPECDVIVALSDVGGVVSEQGRYEELMARDGQFSRFIRDFLLRKEDEVDAAEEEEEEEGGGGGEEWTNGEDDGQDGDDEEDGEMAAPKAGKVASSWSPTTGKTSPRLNILQRLSSLVSDGEDIVSMSKSLTCHSASDLELASPPLYSRQTSGVPIRSARVKRPHLRKRREKASSSKAKKINGNEERKDRLIQEELLESGNVKLSVFVTYIRSLGVILSSFLLLFFVLFQAAALLSNVWLSVWTNDPVIRNATQAINNTDLLQVQIKYLAGYGGFGALQAIFILVYAILSAETNVRSSRTLHRGLLSNVLKSPMSFFDVTPIGRILNRFSKDVETVDNIIINIIRSWLLHFFSIIATVIVVSYSTPIFLVVVVPVLIVYYLVQRFYIPTTRQLKRLESTTRSPIYVHFSETISGATVIRAFDRVHEFIDRSRNLVDNNLVAYFANIASNRWLGFVLDILGGIIILCSALFAVLSRDTLNPSLVGLSLSYALQITMSLSWVVRMGTQLETSIVSVERIKEYTETPSEADWHKGGTIPPNNWPHLGSIDFKDYGLRYRPGLELVLKDVNFSIRPREKIGVVGRTGAGKSSLTLALFRLIESAEGSIVIDGVDIKDVPLYRLRSSLTILPQEPVVFSGTLRMNLDPTSKYCDGLIWKAVELAYMKSFVSSLKEGLDFECGEGGQNMSVGQRQLLCLGRALLHKTTILILDEATAAVDLETDKVIQETIRTQFSDCTVLTIAHRINTILNCDRILVMDAGNVVEFDSPQNLLTDKKSSFYSLARDAGIYSFTP